jgi:hypothetical protein
MGHSVVAWAIVGVVGGGGPVGGFPTSGVACVTFGVLILKLGGGGGGTWEVDAIGCTRVVGAAEQVGDLGGTGGPFDTDGVGT